MGYIRAPRVIVATDGGDFRPLECSVDVSQHQSADTFDATIAIDDSGAIALCDMAPINVTIMATNDQTAGGWVQMIMGQADKVETNFEERTISISGRDMTAQLTDQKTNEKWQNKKPEEIIQDLAGRAGLGTQITGSSKDKAGLKYKDDYNRISELDNFWNVITRMANHMGCIAFVKGQTLYVQPFDQSNGGTYTVWYVPPTPETPAQSNAISITGSRDVNLSKNVTVKHMSWQHKEGKGIFSKYSSSGAGSGNLDFWFKAANLTKAQQDQLAQTKLKEILSHERKCTITMPGDVNIDPMMMLQLSGTGTGFDQSYIMSSIKHSWSYDDGHMMHIDCRNQDSKRGGASQGQ